MSGMQSARVELADANDFVRLVHRHHDPVTGHRFSVGAWTKRGGIVGVAICGRPVARGLDHRSVLEVLRCATNGYPNACSFLYGKAARVASELGFRVVVTYTTVAEQGASLRACGWWPEVLDERSDYTFASNHRTREHKRGKEHVQKVRWIWLTGNDYIAGIDAAWRRHHGGR